MIEKWTLDVLTLSTRLYDFSVVRILFSKADMRHFSAAGIEGLKYGFEVNKNLSWNLLKFAKPVGVDKIVIAEKNVVAKDIAMGRGDTLPPPSMYSFEDFFLSL